MSEVISFRIDEKSLYFGVKNDFKTGHSATVASPINQSENKEDWRWDILRFMDSGLSFQGPIPLTLKNKCLRKTTSKAGAALKQLYVFDKIRFDEVHLQTGHSFALYVKEETDEKILNRKGELVENTHLGRLKLHYPTNLVYSDQTFDIDNHSVLEAILSQNGGFAFVVVGFDVDVDERSLNFNTRLIGPKNVPLSTVFITGKGKGKKLISAQVDQDLIYDILVEDFKLPQRGGNGPDFEAIEKTRRDIGRRGEEYVYGNLQKILGVNVESQVHASSLYATAPYDIEYFEDGVKKYVEVKSTSGAREYFYMSKAEIDFMKHYRDRYTLVLVTNVKDDVPSIKKFDYKGILSLRQESVKTYFMVN